MKSLSNKHMFRLFIEKKQLNSNSGNGKFTIYGLGIETPVPVF